MGHETLGTGWKSWELIGCALRSEASMFDALQYVRAKFGPHLDSRNLCCLYLWIYRVGHKSISSCPNKLFGITVFLSNQQRLKKSTVKLSQETTSQRHFKQAFCHFKNLEFNNQMENCVKLNLWELYLGFCKLENFEKGWKRSQMTYLGLKYNFVIIFI